MSFDAKTALDQLTNSKQGVSRIEVMLGAYNISQDTENNSVQFKMKVGRGFNYCKIKLEADDTYTLILQKYNFRQYKLIENGQFKTKEIKGLYCDQLKSQFEKATGLYLSL